MLRSLIRIVHASLVQIDIEMAEKYAKQQQPAVGLCGKFAFGRYAAGCASALMGLVWHWPLTFWPWNWYASRISGGEPSFRISGYRVIRYVRDGRTDKTNAYCPLFYGRGQNKYVMPRSTNMKYDRKPCIRSAVATVEATEAVASVKILTGAIIISVIKITIVTFNANSTIW